MIIIDPNSNQTAPTLTTPLPVVSTTERYVGFGRRLVAVFIDAIIVNVALQVVFIPLGLVFGFASPFSAGMTAGLNGSQQNGGAAAALFGGMFGTLLLIGLVAQIAYYCGFLVYKQGQTLGKMALGIRVVSIDGAPITWGKALLRELLGKWISGLVFGLGYLWVIWDAKKQAWHDKIANTYVVYAK